MRASKNITISILAIGLLAGSTVGVAAQSAAVEGSMSLDECTELAEGGNECQFVIDASDERLTGSVLVRLSANTFPKADSEGVVVIVNQAVRVETADGAWTGGGVLHSQPMEEAAPFGDNQPTWVLTGEDAYDGLTAVLRVDFGPEATFGGAIVEGELPAAPSLD